MESLKIVYCTDTGLLNEVKDNPTLEGYSCIVVDEVHERSVNTDLLLGMLKKVLKLRPTLRVVLTSATLDRTIFEKFFRDVCCRISGAACTATGTGTASLAVLTGPAGPQSPQVQVPVLFVPGRTFPIEDTYEDSEEDYVRAAWVKALSIHRSTPPVEGDILVFLARVLDIDCACRALKTELGIPPNDFQNESVRVLPLHAKLASEESERVFAPTASPKQRKIIFCTSIAETSVTIDGVVHVIDTGKANVASYDQVRNMTFLAVKSTNKSSVKQRRGRAGRTRPGVCYHLYSYDEYAEMEEDMVPEIRRSNLSLSLLKLFELCGAEGSKISEFEFVERPEAAAIVESLRGLVDMGLISSTEYGMHDVVCNMCL
jgi:HrpA-like RNA helicase